MSQEKSSIGAASLANPILSALWAARRRVLLVGLGCALAGFAASFVMPKTYVAQSILVVSPPPFKSASLFAQENPLAASKTASDTVAALIPRTLPEETYRTLFKSDQILERVIDALKRKEDPDVKIPKLSELKKSFDIQTEIIKQTAYEVQYAPTMLLTARARSAERAALLANLWADEAVKAAQDFASASKGKSKEFLAAQHDSYREQVNDIDNKREKVQREWNEKAMEKQLTEKVTQQVKLEGDLVEVIGQAAAKKHELEQLTKDLPGVGEIKELIKAPPDDAYWILKKGGTEGKTKLGSGDVLRSEELNSAFSRLKEKEVTTDAELQGLLAKKIALEANLKIVQDTVEALRAANALYGIQDEQLKRESEVYSNSYVNIATRLLQADIAEAEKEPDVRKMVDAVPPDKPVPYQKISTVLGAGIVGAVLISLKQVLDVVSRTLS